VVCLFLLFKRAERKFWWCWLLLCCCCCYSLSLILSLSVSGAARLYCFNCDKHRQCSIDGFWDSSNNNIVNKNIQPSTVEEYLFNF
jgi:hypothetical protein